MTGTASPAVPPHANSATSHAADPDHRPDGHPDDARPSTPASQDIDNSEAAADSPVDLICPPSPDESVLSELSDPPPDDEIVPPSPLQDDPPKSDPDASGDGEGTPQPATNGHAEEADAADDGDERPAKRRRVRDSTPPPSLARKIKIESPPWKKVQAEGPTTFQEDGKRRSGRINHVPIEQQTGEKRITRRSLHGQQSPAGKNKYASTNGHGSPPRPANATPQPSARRLPSSGKSSASKTPAASKAPARKAPTPHETRTSTRTGRHSIPPQSQAPLRSSTRTRRPSRTARDSLDLTTPNHGVATDSHPDSTTRGGSKIKLRVRTVAIPFLHPDQAKIKPKLGPSFEEYWQRAQDIPVEEGGQLASDEPPRITDEEAAEEAEIITRIEKEAEDGGLLSIGRCSAYEPEPAEEPPRQWAHMDHLVKAVANFRKLMLQEQQRHRNTARKLAEACYEAWRQKQPKTDEELEQEALELWQGKFRQVVRAAFGTWENVRTEINRQRLEKWEAEEQRRVKAALQEAVQKSEMKLQARRTHADSDAMTDDDSGIERDSEDEDEEDDDDDDDPMASGSDGEVGSDDSGEEGEGEEVDESNMSSSDDDEDAKSALSDEGLTQEQLREKYAHIPDLDTPSGEAGTPVTNAGESRAGETTGVEDETSDESVDMDDDLGSSEMEDSDEDDDGEEGDAEDSDEDEEEGPSNLLGFLFGKSELKKLKAQTVEEEHPTADATAPDAPTEDQLIEAQTEVNGTREGETVPNGEAPAEAEPKTLADSNAVDQSRTDSKPDQVPIADVSGVPTEVTTAEPSTVNGLGILPLMDIADPLLNASNLDPNPDVNPPVAGTLAQLEFSPLDGANKDVLVAPEFSPLTTYDEIPPSDLSPETSAFESAFPALTTPAPNAAPSQDVMMTDSPLPPLPNGSLLHGDAPQPPIDAEIPNPTSLPKSSASPVAASVNPLLSDPKATTPLESVASSLPHEPGHKSPSALLNGLGEDVQMDDVQMDDAPPVADASPQAVPDVEITAPPSSAKVASPETDAVTNIVSLDPSQSPGTADTKATELDTNTSSVEPPALQQEISRSTSPLPTAPKTEIPFLLRGTLREYQHYGLDWLAGLYANNTNGILADEMGLGKTIQTIALLAHLACHHEVWGPHLVIVPTSVMLNWEMEFKKWCPGFKILTYYGNQDERKRKRQGWTNDDVWNVCITSYQMVLQDQQVFRRRRWHYMILDEAHNIKNFKSQRWQTLLGFNTQARLLITGTPLQNNLTELWSLLFFLMPAENGEGGFADLSEFHDWFGRPESQILESGREQMDEEGRAIIAKLHKVLRPYLLRRLKADVEKQMPAKYEHVELCRLSKRQRELYDGFLSRSDTRETLASGNYLSIINCLMQLRKVCNHPDLFVDRPIMTSFRMQRSVPSAFDTTEKLLRRKISPRHPFESVSLEFMNLVPTKHERFSDDYAASVAQYGTHQVLNKLRDVQKTRAQGAFMPLDPSTVASNIIYLESASRWGRFEELQHCVYLNALRRQQKPIYGKRLVELLTIGVQDRPFKPRPKVPKKIMEWFENDSFLLHNAVQTLDRRAESMEMTITKFACVTPAVVTRDLTPFLLGPRGVDAFEEADLRLSAPVKKLPFMPAERPHDPWHEARMRLSIQFPDKRLLQFDCGKLQALDRLLRRLQSGGHRALIFTQMTKVLDILEQFLNIHGHKYLRLDGATKVEQRQILTDRFNHDQRILCFILSTRSGGLGINLTGADTVIFYDQDWNPAMDKQCQDRCHRIGQTRDVHIYRLVSEHTIEANILRKASQKQMLDDVVIQEGEFTTDYFNKISVRDVAAGVAGDGAAADGDGEDGSRGAAGEGDAAANAAMDRVLGGVETADQRTAGRVLGQAEDREDVDAARVAEKEIQQDDADFAESGRPGAGGAAGTAAGSGVSSARQGTPIAGAAGTPTAATAAGAGAASGPAKSGLGIFAELADGGADLQEQPQETTPAVVEYNAWGDRMGTIDDYMLRLMSWQLEGTPLELPKDKKKSKKKKGKDTRKR